MGHKARTGSGRTPQVYAADPSINVGVCATCGKRSYLCRKVARSIAKKTPRHNRPRPYRCPANPEHWHVGHIPSVVRQGALSMDAWRAQITEELP